MKNFYKGKVKPVFIKSVFVLLFPLYALGLDIVVTDASVLPIVQKAAEEISVQQNAGVNVVYVSGTKLPQYLQFGNSGDVAITSNPDLCRDLSQHGLADFTKSKNIITLNIHCSKPKHSWKDFQKVLFFLNKYHPAIEENIFQIAKSLNATIKVVENNENPHGVVSDLLKNHFQICGFKPMLRTFNIAEDSSPTEHSIKYYACPLMSLQHDAYQILITYYETQFIS